MSKEKSILNLEGKDPNKTDPKDSSDKTTNEDTNGYSSQNSSPQETNTQGQNTNKVPPKKKQQSTLVKWLWIMVIVLTVILIFSLIFSPNPKQLSRIDFFTQDALIKQIEQGKTVKIQTSMNNGYYTYAYYQIGDKTYYTLFSSEIHFDVFYITWLNWLPSNVTQPVDVDGNLIPFIDLVPALPSNPQPGILFYLFVQWLPWLIMMVIAWVLIKMIIDKQSSVGKMNKKSMLPQMSNIKFDDVEGYTEVKQELSEVVDFLKNPAKYNEIGARTPKGVLLSGPPGTGKTLFAKAVAGESGIPFYSISGSDFVEMYVGVGASRVRALFQQAKSTAPSLIFIDELDAVGRSRGAGVGGGNDEREQTLNQLLVEMDGFAANTGIVVMAATNRPDVLDPALKRPGRFDRSVEIRLPDVKEREAILRLHASKGNKKISDDVEWLNIAMRTPGFSGAELENVINEAAILSIRMGRELIDLELIDEAIDRVIGGPAKVNNTMSKEEKNLVAHHEAGHALIGLMLKDAEKVQKISIVPRGQAGGYVLMTPKKEKIVQTKAELFAKIVSYMGGRVSEEIFFGPEQITTGAYSDIQEATKIARRMVTEFGMSTLGPIQFEKNYGSPFLGGGHNSQEKFYSEKISFEIDKEVAKLINDSYIKATEVISKNKPMIELFSEALMIKEVLNTEDIEYIYKNKKLTDAIIELKNRENNTSKKTKSKKEQEPKENNNQKEQESKEEI